MYYKLLQLQTKALAMRGSNRDGSRIWSILRMPGFSSGIWARGCRTIVREETARGDAVSVEKYDMRLRDQAENRSVALVAVYHGAVAGYIHCTGKRDRALCRYGHPGDRGFRRAGKIPQKRDRHPPYGRGGAARPGIRPGRLPGRRPAQRVRRRTAAICQTGVSSGRFGGYGTGTPSASLTPFAAMTTI